MSSASTESRIGTQSSRVSKKRLESPDLEEQIVFRDFLRPISIPKMWGALVPEYKARTIGPILTTVRWDPKYARAIKEISPKRADSRCNNYIIENEIPRVAELLIRRGKGEASMRFGNSKPGHGYSGKRGDFCLVAGIFKRRELILCYRSLEMLGGFAYDLCLVRELERRMNIQIQTLRIFSAHTFVFALKGNSNEKLYPRLKEIFCE